MPRERSGKLTFPLLASAVVIEAALLSIRAAENEAEQVALILAAYAVAGAAFAAVVRLLYDDSRARQSRTALTIVIAAGVVFRLTLWTLTPATTQDVQRYLWEGLVQREGFSPYVLPPTASVLAPLAQRYDATWRRINHPDIPAIYPPTAQMLFRANACVFDGSLYGWKCFLLIFDALLAVGAATHLKRRGRSLLGVAGVWWCPLLLIETYEGGHLDVVGATLLFAALIAMTRRRLVLSAVALGLALNVKYLCPLAVMILFIRRIESWFGRFAFLATVAATCCACWIPYRQGLAEAIATVRMFAEHWTFNDVIFELLRAAPVPRWAPMALVVLCLAALASIPRAGRDRGIWSDAWLLLGAAMLLGPVAYPWYFLWLAPALVFRPPLWLTAWILVVPALHLVDLHYVRTGVWDPMQWLWQVVGLAPAVLLAIAWRNRFRRQGVGD